MNVVEKFINEETSKSNWLERLFNNYPVFYFAKDISIVGINTLSDNSFIVSPSITRRFFAIIFMCVGLFGWFSILLLVIMNILFPISMLFLLLISVWIGFILWTFFLNPKYSFKIWMDKDGIKLNKTTFKWENITEYLLMEKGMGRHFTSTLVLFTEDRTFKYNLTNLNTSGQEIMKRIKLFKNEHS
jgi:hypothetical protein